MDTCPVGEHRPNEHRGNEDIVASSLSSYVPRRADVCICAMVRRVSDVPDIFADV